MARASARLCSQVNYTSVTGKGYMLHLITHVLFSSEKNTPTNHKSATKSPRIPCTVTAKLQGFLRNFNVKQKGERGRGQRSKITLRSLVSSACFLLTIPLRALVPALQCVCECVCAHIGLNKPRDAVRVTQLPTIQPGLALPLLLQAFQRPTTVHFPCCCCWLGPTSK